MQYFISFLEGIITFVSPCLLPMLPIYISYFAGDSERDTKRVVKNALGFILGFTLVFVLLGALAGSLGTLLQEYSAVVNLVTGLIVIFFGLNFLGVFRVNLFRGTKLGNVEHLGFFSSLLFGVVFSVGWTPCVGPSWARRCCWPPARGTSSRAWPCCCCTHCGWGAVFHQRRAHRQTERGVFLYQAPLPGYQPGQRRLFGGHWRADGYGALWQVPGAAVIRRGRDERKK